MDSDHLVFIALDFAEICVNLQPDPAHSSKSFCRCSSMFEKSRSLVRAFSRNSFMKISLNCFVPKDGSGLFTIKNSFRKEAFDFPRAFTFKSRINVARDLCQKNFESEFLFCLPIFLPILALFASSNRGGTSIFVKYVC
jgi:hypothetical protein